MGFPLPHELHIRRDFLIENTLHHIAKLKTGRLPHKTVALRAGLGFIGKNNLLVTPEYGCALMLGKVLTTAPFVTTSEMPKQPQCGDCNICVNVCPSEALLGKTWSLNTTRDEIMVRKLCTLCLKCMVFCPYTAKYIQIKKIWKVKYPFHSLPLFVTNSLH